MSLMKKISEEVLHKQITQNLKYELRPTLCKYIPTFFLLEFENGIDISIDDRSLNIISRNRTPEQAFEMINWHLQRYHFDHERYDLETVVRLMFEYYTGHIIYSDMKIEGERFFFETDHIEISKYGMSAKLLC